MKAPKKIIIFALLVLALSGCGGSSTNPDTCVQDSYGSKCFRTDGNTVYEWGTMTVYTNTNYITEFKTTLPIPVKTVLSAGTDYPSPVNILFSGDPVDTIDIFVIHHASGTSGPVDPSTQINWSIEGTTIADDRTAPAVEKH